MEKEKRIEEMVKIMLEKAFENYETSGSVEIDTQVRRHCYSVFLVYCEALYNAGYRKIPEIPKNSVLTDEEYERWQGQTMNLKKIRKETAEGK